MRVEVLGAVAVRQGQSVVDEARLGGRRARVVLVALALAGHPLPAERLADVIWGESLPPTWPTALRGVIRQLRSACAPLDGGEPLITTTPSGYGLREGTDTDLMACEDALHRAQDLQDQGRHRAALELAAPVAELNGSDVLADEDAAWLDPYRRAVDTLAARALELVVTAARGSGQYTIALDAATRAVAADPLDERAHRALIAAYDGAGDRAGAVQAFESCRAVLADQLGIDPSPETVDTYLSALRDQAPTRPARIPTTSTTFWGRDTETALLGRELDQPGLVTVSGRGGVGKSRLAERVARETVRFPDGRLWVSVAHVAQDALVAATVALELGVSVGADDATPAIVDHLAPLGRVLLVLDGCEAVVDGVASLVVDLLAGCPRLTVLATSRVPLGVDDERVVAVDPWPQPGTDADPDAFRDDVALSLLMDRVQSAGAIVEISEGLAPHLTTLLRRCGGLPLAVELAAAQIAAMPVGDLVDHLAEVSGAEDDRLRAVARSSYALLEADEATVFRRLGALDGPTGLPLIRQVVAGGGIEPVRIVRILRELSARGLVIVDRSEPRWRYRHDDDLRRFARELLTTTGEERSVFARLADALRGLLPDDARASPAPFAAAVSEVLSSVRSLFAASLDGRADLDPSLELAFRLHRYFAATNVAEGRYWLSRLLAASDHAGDHGGSARYATYALGYLSYWAGDAAAAMDQLSRAIALLRGVADPYVARASIFLAGLYDDVDRGADAVETVRGAIAAAAPFDVDLQVAAAMGMGSVLAERGDPTAAEHAGNAVELCRAGGSPDYLALVLPTAATVCWQVGALEQCRGYVAEALPMHAEGRRIARVVLLTSAAGLALSDGDLDAALDFGRQADLEATELGIEREVPLVRAVLARTLLARGDLVGAVDRAIAALDAAETLSYTFPLATCLETAALVAAELSVDTRSELATLLATAEVIRARGSRPPPSPLADAVARLRGVVGAAAPEEPPIAAEVGRRLLSAAAT